MKGPKEYIVRNIDFFVVIAIQLEKEGIIIGMRRKKEQMREINHTDLIYTLQDDTIPTIEQVGGKGLSLIHSAKKGFNIPPTVVLSSNFFSHGLNRLNPLQNGKFSPKQQGMKSEQP